MGPARPTTKAALATELHERDGAEYGRHEERERPVAEHRRRRRANRDVVEDQRADEAEVDSADAPGSGISPPRSPIR
jgi:hypothetical protein